ncbi:MAG: hypothetical protein OXH09_20475 [Gammaproteobacteria bacterium]|nr:hypothetical protein [Gammaproteobacteria bacterium]
MGIDVHRPLTMRLLHDAKEGSVPNAELADVLGPVGAWITRMWLADRPLAGLNKATAELANGSGPGEGEDLAGHWRGRIDRLRNSRVGVPHDEAVTEGIRTRKAYGGSATRTSFAVLCAMMEAESREESPARDRLTLEHVMPRHYSWLIQQALGAPKSSSVGHAVGLAPRPDCAHLAAELIHARIDYRPEHWVAVGTLNEPELYPAHIAQLRDKHLQCLRSTPGNADYGSDCVA